jgi:hypothetical protein
MKNPHAVALGKRGGKARAEKTTPEQRKQWAASGGKVRAKRHSKAELREWAKLGGRPKMPWSQLNEGGKRARKYRQEKSAKGDKQ